MIIDANFFLDLFFHQLGLWWVVIPSIFLGLIVGGIPGFSAANTIIVLLPFTFLSLSSLVPFEFAFSASFILFCSSKAQASTSGKISEQISRTMLQQGVSLFLHLSLVKSALLKCPLDLISSNVLIPNEGMLLLLLLLLKLSPWLFSEAAFRRVLPFDAVVRFRPIFLNVWETKWKRC